MIKLGGNDITGLYKGSTPVTGLYRGNTNIWMPDSGPSIVPMGDIVSSCVFDLDATISASYSGSGTTWANYEPTPADGSSQTDYDMVLGNGSTSSTYPTFNGTPGDSSAYWSFDGGDYMGILSGSNTTFLNQLHLASGGHDFTVAIAMKIINTGNYGLMGTMPSLTSTGYGVNIFINSSEQWQFRQRASTSSAIGQSLGSALSSPVDYVLIASVPAGGGSLRYWANTTTKSTIIPLTYSSGSGTPSSFRIGNMTTYPIQNGVILYGTSWFNAFIDDAEAAAIIAQYNLRHGRTYA